MFPPHTCQLERATWTQLAVGRPIARSYGQLVYDVHRRRTLLFGGVYQLGTPSAVIFNDTFEWDGQRWAPTSPDTSPSPRFAHAMAYDAAHDTTVMFGGSSFIADTWTWDGSE